MYSVVFFLWMCLALHADENELKNAASPYLRQHSSNPVLWHEWSEKSFDLARKLHKPVFLSIGYSTCHWCHVMERESFSDEQVSRLLNRYFVAIKVDKEELPFVDIYYQRLFSQTQGHYGGWPLHVILTPDKKVFYMTGYIPKYDTPRQKGFLTLLPKLHALFEEKNALASAIDTFSMKTKHLASMTSVSKKRLLEDLANSFKSIYDDFNGGFGDAPKFLQPQKMLLLMDVAKSLHDDELIKMLYETLHVTALRGIYDSVEGGWFRYSVDASWEIPHFEKMLYTQAEMILLYAKAFQSTHDPLYKKVVQESVAMLDRHFHAASGGYFSALDADSAGKEGTYYLFSTAEMYNALQHCKNKGLLKTALGAEEWPNFHNMVHISLSGVKRPVCWKEIREELLTLRRRKKLPFRDEKINTAWNAMLAEALYEASGIDESYRKKADDIVAVIERKLFDKGRLYHYFIDTKRPQTNELLEDYAFYAATLLKKYTLTLDANDLAFARYLLLHAKDTFFKNGVLLLSDAPLAVPAKPQDKYYTSAYGKYLLDILHYCELTHDAKMCRFGKKLLQLERVESDAPSHARAFLEFE